MVYADANIIIRYIINDDKAMAEKAEAAINDGTIFILPEVFAEVVYVLTKVYGINRKDVAVSMIELLDYASTIDSAVMKKAFEYFKKSKLDFVDCILAAHRIVKQKEILSFDKKLNAFIARNRATILP